MVKIQRSFRILRCLWDVLVISILEHVVKWLPVQMCHRETNKLISETNRWTGLYTIQFLPEGRSETMLHYWCWSGKYTTVLCFGIGGGDSRVRCPFYTWRVEVFWSVLWCPESLWDWGEFFILVQVRLRDVKNEVSDLMTRLSFYITCY